MLHVLNKCKKQAIKAILLQALHDIGQGEACSESPATSDASVRAERARMERLWEIEIA